MRLRLSFPLLASPLRPLLRVRRLPSHRSSRKGKKQKRTRPSAARTAGATRRILHHTVSLGTTIGRRTSVTSLRLLLLVPLRPLFLPSRAPSTPSSRFGVRAHVRDPNLPSSAPPPLHLLPHLSAIPMKTNSSRSPRLSISPLRPVSARPHPLPPSLPFLPVRPLGVRSSHYPTQRRHARARHARRQARARRVCRLFTRTKTRTLT
jgi:hypothetical protein